MCNGNNQKFTYFTFARVLYITSYNRDLVTQEIFVK